MKLRVKSDRTAITTVEEEISGQIIVAPISQDPRKGITSDYMIARVLETGNPDYVTKGQLIITQIPKIMRNMTTHKVDGQEFFFVHNDDILGTLSAPKISLENFQIAGHWVLVRYFTDKLSNLLVIPDNYTPNIKDFRFKILQVGSVAAKSELAFKVGDEVALEKGKATPLVFTEGEEFAFVHKEHVYATITEDSDTVPTEKANNINSWKIEVPLG